MWACSRLKTCGQWFLNYPLSAPPFGRALFFTEFLTERGESLLHKLKRDESSG